MSNEQVGGAQTTESSASVVNAGSVEQQQEPKVVKWEDHKRALDDMVKFKQALREREARESELQNKLKTLEEKGLQEKQDYKSLWEKEAQRAKDAEEKYKQTLQSVVYNEKYSAVSQALLKAGIIPDALEDINHKVLEDVVVETTSEGRFIINGVETFVDSFKRKKPYLFKSAAAPTVNGGGGATSAASMGEVTPAMVVEAESDMKKDPLNKDKKERYYSLLNRYQEQKRKK